MNQIKYSKINRYMILLFAAAFSFTGCKKDDGPIKKEILSLIDEVPVISTAIDATGSQSIDLLNLGAFNGKFTVSRYFADAPAPEKVDIVVRKTDASGKTVKVFKTDIATFPASVTVTAAELAALFGPIKLNDSYDFAPDIYYKGKKYEAFPLGGVSRGPGPGAFPGFSEYTRFSAICAYDPNLYQGDFEVIRDDWEDFSVGDIITLTKVDNSSFSWVNPFAVASTPVPIVVKVNTGNNTVAIPRTVIGTKWVWSATYTGPAVATTGAATSSFVAPCDKTVTLNMQYSVDQGTFAGGWLLVLKKKL